MKIFKNDQFYDILSAVIKMRKIKAVIFDMDGIITDSEKWAKQIMFDILKDHGLPYSDEIYNPLLGINMNQAIEYLNTITNSTKISKEMLDQFSVNILKALSLGKVPFKKGAIELIDSLNEANFPIALATSGSKEKVRVSFNGNNREVPFTHIITGDMVTCSKPNPEIFLLAAKEMNIDIKNCLILEDSYNGLKAALNAEAIACMVPDLLEPTEELKKQVIIKKDLFEVKEMLKENAIL